jgi:hypothetical protein
MRCGRARPRSWFGYAPWIPDVRGQSRFRDMKHDAVARHLPVPGGASASSAGCRDVSPGYRVGESNVTMPVPGSKYARGAAFGSRPK